MNENQGTNYAITCDNINFKYKNGIKALTDINLKFEKNRIHIILGPNGAGKTTLIRLMTSELKIQNGLISIFGYDVFKNRKEIIKKIGVMPQQALLYKQLTAWEHTLYFTMLKGINKVKSMEESEKILKLLDIYDRKDEILYSFSGGMSNAISLAQALSGKSEILFLDEPTVGLDPKRRRIIWDYLKQIKMTKTIIFTTQYLDEAHELADTITIIEKGRLIHSNNVESTIKMLDYELKLELKKSEKVLEVIKLIKNIKYKETDDKITIWVKNKKNILEKLLNAGIDFTEISFQRPLLEDAYRNILGNEYI